MAGGRTPAPAGGRTPAPAGSRPLLQQGRTPMQGGMTPNPCKSPGRMRLTIDGPPQAAYGMPQGGPPFPPQGVPGYGQPGYGGRGSGLGMNPERA